MLLYSSVLHQHTIVWKILFAGVMQNRRNLGRIGRFADGGGGREPERAEPETGAKETAREGAPRRGRSGAAGAAAAGGPETGAAGRAGRVRSEVNNSL